MSYDRPNEPPESDESAHGSNEEIFPLSVNVARDGTVTLQLADGGELTVQVRGWPPRTRRGAPQRRSETVEPHDPAAPDDVAPDDVAPAEPAEVCIVYTGWPPGKQTYCIRLDTGWPPGGSAQ